jgi:hypothetical protein
MGGVTGDLEATLIVRSREIMRLSIYLVAKTLRRNNGDFIANALVGLEVEGELGVVTLNDNLC